MIMYMCWYSRTGMLEDSNGSISVYADSAGPELLIQSQFPSYCVIVKPAKAVMRRNVLVRVATRWRP